MLFSDELKSTVECLLFVAREPLTAKVISEIIDLKPEEVEILIDDLRREYELQNRGMQIISVASGYQMCTKAEYASYIEKLYRPQVNPLSKASLETLAIIAYRQPITRAEIEAIRGVKVEGIISGLLEKRLIKEVGRKEGPGRPILYGTTVEFLHYLGLNSLKDLPSLELIQQANAPANENDGRSNP